MSLRRFVTVILLLVSWYWPCLASTNALVPSSLTSRERKVWFSAKRNTEFVAVPHTTATANCHATRPPEALATPNPLLDQPGANANVQVSFIIGTDGRVHSPFILESAGPSEDRIVLDTVRSWRYRPAMCNGVPTEAEAKIGFSSR